MEPGQIVSGIVVSLIAGIVGWLTNKSSNKASVTNVTTSSRVEMEKEAYERARKLDTDTIKRQDEEIDEVRVENKQLKESMELVQQQNRQLNEDVARMSRDSYEQSIQHRNMIEENRRARSENERLRAEVDSFRRRLARLEQRGLGPDTNPMMPEVGNGQ